MPCLWYDFPSPTDLNNVRPLLLLLFLNMLFKVRVGKYILGRFIRLNFVTRLTLVTYVYRFYLIYLFFSKLLVIAVGNHFPSVSSQRILCCTISRKFSQLSLLRHEKKKKVNNLIRRCTAVEEMRLPVCTRWCVSSWCFRLNFLGQCWHW